MSQQSQPPVFSKAEAAAAVRRNAATLIFDPRVDLLLHKIDEDDVCRWLADCDEIEVDKHEVAYEWPVKPHYIVVLHLDVDDEFDDTECNEYYVKVRLILPRLTNGRVISFWPWDHRYDRAS